MVQATLSDVDNLIAEQETAAKPRPGITAAMVRAGNKAMVAFGTDYDGDDLVTAIYSAMWHAGEAERLGKRDLVADGQVARG